MVRDLGHQGFARLQRGSGHYEVHLLGEFGEEESFFQCLVVVADDGHRLVTEESTIAGSTVAHAPAQKFSFARHATGPPHRAGGHNNRFGLVGVGSGHHHLGIGGKIYAHNFVGQKFSAKRLGLLAHRIHQFCAADRSGDTGIVADLGGDT